MIGSVVLPAVLGNPYWTHNFTIVSLFITVAVLQNLLLSDAGQVSFGQGAVFGAGAYMTGIVSGLWGYPFAVGFLSGLAASIAMGLLFAAPALRVQSFYLGFVTLSAALVFPEMLVAFSDITNGINGIALPRPGAHDRGVRGPELDLDPRDRAGLPQPRSSTRGFGQPRWGGPCASRRSARKPR